MSNMQKNGEGSHVETTYGVPEFHNSYYPQNRMMRLSRLGRKTAKSYAHWTCGDASVRRAALNSWKLSIIEGNVKL